jgi:hypothetical protein
LISRSTWSSVFAVVASERVGAEGLEGLAQTGFGALMRLEALCKDGAGDYPADERAKTKTKNQREDRGNQIDGHQYRITL